MKDQFEKNFKESLENFELPYDANAWNSLSKKLDLTQPTTATPKSGASASKWFVAAGIVTIASIATYFIVTENSPENNTTLSETTIEATSNETAVENNENTSESISEQKTDAPSEQDLKSTITEKNSTANKIVRTENPNHIISHEAITQQKVIEATNVVDHSKIVVQNESPNSTSTTAIVAPKVADLCMGEFASLKNENGVDLTIITPQNDRLVLRASKSFKFELKEAGRYKIMNGSDEITHFNVSSAPKIDFSIDEQTQFEDGVPSIPLTTYSEGTLYEWSFEGTKHIQTGKKAAAHFFTKGSKTITLTVENEKGCRSKISKEVSIAEDYMLFAPNAFEPTHSDYRRNKFIPAALLVRDIAFTMIIVDPRSGATVYSTSNANDGWDGIDKNTGDMVTENTTYIWKVSLKNPLPGEKSDYSGTVVRK